VSDLSSSNPHTVPGITSEGDDFAGRAEAHRRQGLSIEAERVAREGLAIAPSNAECWLVLGLALLDQGDAGQAHRELSAATERLLPSRADQAAAAAGQSPAPAATPTDFSDEVADEELDFAFDAAETEREGLVDADQVAQQALRQVENALPPELAAQPGAPFATHTMAELLEKQGDPDTASKMRASIGGVAGAGPPAGGHRAEIIGELERWLGNLRGQQP
jgi:tetratricopeptide (TPR) repeat protein